MMDLKLVGAALGGAVAFPVCWSLIAKIIHKSKPHEQFHATTPHGECLEHLEELDQRAKKLWQPPGIPEGSWGKSHTRIMHSSLCDTHRGIESRPWDVQRHGWEYIMDKEMSEILLKYYASHPHGEGPSSQWGNSFT